MDAICCVLLVMWFLHVATAVVVGYPVIRPMWRRAVFAIWEAWAFIIPFTLWMSCYLVASFGDAGWGKSLTNIALEPFLVSAAIIVAAMARAIVGQGPWTRLISQSLIGALSAFAVCLFFFVPGLPE